MNISERKQHTIGLILLSLTAVLWGLGFVLNAELQKSSFNQTPAMLNAVRFVGAALALSLIFNKKLRFNKKTLLYGGVGGILLFAGFQLQLVGLGYSTPAHCGFFTATYFVFVPLIAWIAYKKRPSWVVFIGVAVATIGLVILNVNGEETSKDTLPGDLLTLAGAILFALQIVWSDYALKKQTDYSNLTFWQVLFAGVLFVLYSAIFESKNYNIASFDWAYCSWRLVIVVLGGTAFAYYAQTFAQTRLTPSETSLILACESPIGAVISLIAGIDKFSWTIIVGGLLVIAAVITVELVPSLLLKRKEKGVSESHHDTVSDESEQE